ncbi:MAG TPA: NUDIX domain-containing protein [Actinomycetes bacterium]|nr:NUDIX domain-containing protein [Actinomycetes bacterium]
MADGSQREAARVLLLDEQDRLLLFRGADPARPDLGSWWFTPGGGLHPGETPEGGARRELFEETGLAADTLEGPVWHRVAEFDFAGEHYRQSELFFVVRVATHEVDTSGFQPLEASAIDGHRWWSLEELRTTAERVYPAALAAELDRLLAGRAPATPYEVA